MEEKETIIETLEKAGNYLYELDKANVAPIKQIANAVGYLGLSYTMENYEFSVTFCPNKKRFDDILSICVFEKCNNSYKCIFAGDFKAGKNQFLLFGKLSGAIRRSLLK